jgi:RNA polymerase sigma-70 factor (ECF subfamily)
MSDNNAKNTHRFDSPQSEENNADLPLMKAHRSTLHTTEREPMELSDEVLFAKFVAGDEGAFSTIYERYAAPLRRYIRAKTRMCASDIDDVLQQTFCRVVQHKLKFTEGRLVKPWLYTIADRLSRDAMKTHAVRTKMAHTYGDLTIDRKLGDGVVKSRTAEEIVETMELGRRAMKLLHNLPKNLRSTVQLSVISGLPNRASGPLMRVSHVQVHNRLKMALDILRKQMETEDADKLEDCTPEQLLSETLHDCIDALDDADYASLERVINGYEVDNADAATFAKFVRRMVGEVVS